MKTNAARICVPVCVARATELAQAIARAAEVADIIELRLDCLLAAELASAKSTLTSLIDKVEALIILTMRSDGQGGRVSLSLAQRLHFCSSICSTDGNCFRDF